jgi:lysophospholipase L1-like esterase
LAIIWTASTGCAGSTAIKPSVGLAAMLGLAWMGLAGGGPSVASPARPPNADPAFPFSNELEAFAKADAATPPISNATLFLGSSSIRLWDIAGSFRTIGTVNRGFGGATTPDVLHYYKRLLPPEPPRAVIVYVGENDLAAGARPDRVARDVTRLLDRLRADYPRARIAYLSLKPSPIRWTLWPRMQLVNKRVARQAAARRIAYLDVGRVLLAQDGLPDASLFRPDGLHMNARGYARWTELVERWLNSLPPIRGTLGTHRPALSD